MTQTEITTIKNNAVTMPRTWRGSRVFVRITDDSATITKIPSAKKIFTARETRSLRQLGAKITPAALANAIRAARKR